MQMETLIRSYIGWIGASPAAPSCLSLLIDELNVAR